LNPVYIRLQNRDPLSQYLGEQARVLQIHHKCVPRLCVLPMDSMLNSTIHLLIKRIPLMIERLGVVLLNSLFRNLDFLILKYLSKKMLLYLTDILVGPALTVKKDLFRFNQELIRN